MACYKRFVTNWRYKRHIFTLYYNKRANPDEQESQTITQGLYSQGELTSVVWLPRVTYFVMEHSTTAKVHGISNRSVTDFRLHGPIQNRIHLHTGFRAFARGAPKTNNEDSTRVTTHHSYSTVRRHEYDSLSLPTHFSTGY